MFVSLGGLIISWFVGIKLPGLEYNNQRVEASFRKELAKVEKQLERVIVQEQELIKEQESASFDHEVQLEVAH